MERTTLKLEDVTTTLRENEWMMEEEQSDDGD